MQQAIQNSSFLLLIYANVIFDTFRCEGEGTMKTLFKLAAILLGSALLLSGCSAVSSMLYGDAKEAAPDTNAERAAVQAFTFYDSYANW